MHAGLKLREGDMEGEGGEGRGGEGRGSSGINGTCVITCAFESSAASVSLACLPRHTSDAWEELEAGESTLSQCLLRGRG